MTVVVTYEADFNYTYRTYIMFQMSFIIHACIAQTMLTLSLSQRKDFWYIDDGVVNKITQLGPGSA